MRDIHKNVPVRFTPEDRLAGVTDALAALREKGYKLAIGSSSKNTPVILEKIGYAGYFDAVSDGNNITRSKPDPEVFLKAAQFLGLSPEECYVVEDAEAGVDAAKAGGFTAIGVGGAAGYEKTDYPISTMADVLKLI